MTRVEQLESAPVTSGDPIGMIVGLANEVRALSIAADARRMSERFESSRFFVAIVGHADSVRPIVERVVGDNEMLPLDHVATFRFARFPHAQVTFRDGSRRAIPISSALRLARAGVAAIEIHADRPLLRSGVCLSVGPPSMRRSYRRVDLVVTSRSDADETARLWHGVRTIVVDSNRPDDIERAMSLLTELAAESGAARVEPHVAQYQRHLCLRLGHHLFEQGRALLCSPHAMLVRISGLTVARVLAESVLEARSRQPDSVREALASWLAVERTKFLMGTRADALLALDDQLQQASQSRHQLRAAAGAASHAIAVELLAKLWRRTVARAGTSIAALSRSLLTDLDVSLGDLGEHVSPQALTGFDLAPIRGLRRDLEWPIPSGIVTQIADRCCLASRARLQSAARDELIVSLTNGSRRIIEMVLLDYDEANSAIESRFCELLDSALESVQLAAELAQEALDGGGDGVARARDRIARWSIELDRIMRRLE